MGAQLRVYRRRIRSVQSTKKITRAFELISASRIVRAQQRVFAARPYTAELVKAIELAATYAHIDHPLIASPGKRSKRAAVLVLASDRGFAGAYASSVIKQAEQLQELLRNEGKESELYLVGRKAVSYYSFRNRPIAQSWSGFTEAPAYANAREIADVLLESFLADSGVDEIHVVYTHFRSAGSQEPRAMRVLPLVVEDSEATGAVEGIADDTAAVSNAENSANTEAFPLYEFEPSPEYVLDRLLPRYVANLIYSAMLQAAASEHAARQRAMKSATDNADALIKELGRKANAARQAEITQEISEIVGGADALADAS